MQTSREISQGRRGSVVPQANYARPRMAPSQRGQHYFCPVQPSSASSLHNRSLAQVSHKLMPQDRALAVAAVLRRQHNFNRSDRALSALAVTAHFTCLLGTFREEPLCEPNRHGKFSYLPAGFVTSRT